MTKEEVRKHVAIIHNMAKDYGILTNEEINDTYKVLNYIDQQDQIIREAREYVNFIAIAKIAFAEEEEMLNPFVRFSKTKWGKELLEILDRNVNNE